MHEFSIVRALLDQVAQLAAAHGGGAVEEIRVEVGPLSGVEPALVQSAFGALAQHKHMPGATLTIEEVDLTGRCTVCNHSFVIEAFQFRCTACAANAIEVTGGDEFRLLDITLQYAERSPENERHEHDHRLCESERPGRGAGEGGAVSP